MADDTKASELMTDAHIQLLSSKRKELVSNMQPADVLNELESCGALPDKRIIAEIKAGKVREEQVECLLDKLATRPDWVFDALVRALLSTNQPHLSNLLTGIQVTNCYQIVKR